MKQRYEIQGIGTPLTDDEQAQARHFWHVQFPDIFVESILKEGYRVFILYELDGVQQWTYSKTFHSSFEMAWAECLEVRKDGIIDMKDGIQRLPDIKRIVIQPFPVG